MEIYLIRHTTPKIDKEICYGQTNVAIADTFMKEAELIKQKLSLQNDKGLVVYSSPLIRCMKLAAFLSKMEPVIDEHLMELNFGDWEMKHWNDIDKIQLNNWMDNFTDVPCPNGESYAMLYKRSIEFITGLKSKEHSNVAVVTHAGVIRSILAYIMNKPLKDSFDIKVGYGEMFRVSFWKNISGLGNMLKRLD